MERDSPPQSNVSVIDWRRPWRFHLLHAIDFDDGRGAFPDVIRARVPRGFRSQVKQAAQAAGMPLSEFVRRAISAYLDEDAGHAA